MQTLTEVFGWQPGLMGPNRACCEKVRRAEQVLSITLSPQQALESALAGCDHVTKTMPGLPAILGSRDPMAPDVINKFAAGGGSEYIAFIKVYGGPTSPIPLVDEYRRTGPDGVRELLDIAGFPDNLPQEQEVAMRNLASLRWSAIAEQVEFLRSCGEGRFLPSPKKLRAGRNDALYQPTNPPAADEIDVDTNSYQNISDKTRYSIADLDSFVATYAREVGAARKRFAAIIETMPPFDPAAAPRVVLPDLTYGVEIEGFFENWVPNSVGQEAIRHAFSKAGLDGWKLTTDHSIQRISDDGEDTRNDHPECVSPVMNGKEAPETIARALHTLWHLGLNMNESCGLHVNVGDPYGIGLAQAKSVLLSYAFNQDAIDEMLPKHRHSGRCEHAGAPHSFVNLQMHGRRTKTEVLSMFRSLVSGASSSRELIERTNNKGKHTATNLGKLDLGYVEFRQLHGTLNPDVVVDFMHLCGKMVEMGRSRPLDILRINPDFKLGLGVSPDGPGMLDLVKAREMALRLERAGELDTPGVSQ